MVLGRVKIHCPEKEIKIILEKVKQKLTMLGYVIRSHPDVYHEHQSLKISQGLFKWLLDFNIRLDRTGNLVTIEISRETPFSFDKIIENRRKRMERRRGQAQTSFLGSIWRFWWLAYIISFVAGIFLSVLPTNEPIKILGYILLGIVGIALLFYAFNLFQRFYLKKHEVEKAKKLTKQLQTILESLNSNSKAEKMICWSCFKEIVPKDNICPECSVKLIKV